MKNNIVLVPFPFDDYSASKVRPAICLTSEKGRFEHVVVAFISSNIKNKKEEFDILIEKNTPLAKDTGLAVDSIIKLHRIVTIPKTLIKRYLGKSNYALSEKIDLKLKQLFELE